MLLLNKEQIQKLEEFIQELPVKFGVPLLNLIRSFATENKESEKENTKPNETE